jgi:hypothetical protein
MQIGSFFCKFCISLLTHNTEEITVGTNTPSSAATSSPALVLAAAVVTAAVAVM